MLQQPYNLKPIDEQNFSDKIEKMIKSIEDVKQIIVCDDSLPDDVECTDKCPLKLICGQMNHILMWNILNQIYSKK